MKNLITAIACTVLLMAFVVQFAHHQVLFQQMAIVNQAADLYAEKLIREGDSERAPTDAEAWLKERISDVMGCGMDEVRIEEKDGACQISFPVLDVLASPAFWGVAEEENCAVYVIRREFADSAAPPEEAEGGKP